MISDDDDDDDDGEYGAGRVGDDDGDFDDHVVDGDDGFGYCTGWCHSCSPILLLVTPKPKTL